MTTATMAPKRARQPKAAPRQLQHCVRITDAATLRATRSLALVVYKDGTTVGFSFTNMPAAIADLQAYYVGREPDHIRYIQGV